MRTRHLLLMGTLFTLVATPVSAQRAQVQAPPAAAAQPQQSPEAAQIESLQQRLLAGQQTIATLERELAETRNRAVLMDACRVKNGRLVAIARELIEGYERRYRQTRRDPLQLGRRKFEFELQALSDAVYDNRVDVPPVPLPGEARGASAGQGVVTPATGELPPSEASPESVPVVQPSPAPAASDRSPAAASPGS